MTIPGNSTEPSPLAALARFGWHTALTLGLIALGLGIVVLAWPHGTLEVVGVLFGIYLVISGILQIVLASTVHVSTGLRVLGFISGALSLLLGLLCFRGAYQSVLLLSLWIGIGLLFRGITATVGALDLPGGTPGRGWQIALGLIAAIAGVILLVDPFNSILALTVMAGIWLVLIGLVEIGHAISLRSRAKHLV
ncbi:HdeD family acid-resistance protein [Kitasatospora sp. NPDC058965]|uniref:HdeD family acid-resistance protein n=1 Tax=Kitasatospora sp. NPDC058965 TaxID=3346682 RepID=UPI0036AF62B9